MSTIKIDGGLFVAGTKHLNDKSVFDQIKAGDEVRLVWEPDNSYDGMHKDGFDKSKAVRVETQDGKKLGYLPSEKNTVVARLLMVNAAVCGIIKYAKPAKKKTSASIWLDVYLR